MKVVINRCYGGFGLSDECAIALGAVLKQLGGYFYQEFLTVNGRRIIAPIPS